MYEQSGILVAAILFLALLAAVETGYRFGRRQFRQATDSGRTQVNVLQASLLGTLALLIGFSFSLALQRYESRSAAVVEEANAVGTAWLRADLLPALLRAVVRQTLRNYLDVRLQSGSVTGADAATRNVFLVRSSNVLNELWEAARQSVEQDGRPTTSGLFVESVNSLIDNYGSRNATLDRHVPPLVMWLLFGSFLFSGMVVGYGAGLAGHRASFATYMMVALIVLLVFMVIDLIVHAADSSR